ncbi:uncharacterized protein ARMOST_17361 [Armillaria ostoyae]|uniref:Uncharacterized protein n=1 Tax=Armillaria ostoyae TaxID=47428 RepID=A0A284RYS4_ARMOS|nr:uncharacterized protein ARMOST_17361 [Armillaria ostoyae]
MSMTRQMCALSLTRRKRKADVDGDGREQGRQYGPVSLPLPLTTIIPLSHSSLGDRPASSFSNFSFDFLRTRSDSGKVTCNSRQGVRVVILNTDLCCRTSRCRPLHQNLHLEESLRLPDASNLLANSVCGSEAETKVGGGKILALCSLPLDQGLDYQLTSLCKTDKSLRKKPALSVSVIDGVGPYFPKPLAHLCLY